MERVRETWRLCGADVRIMTPQTHDKVFATVSHLPHLLAYALVHDVATHADAATFFDYAAERFPRLHAHRLQPPGDVARHLRRQPRANCGRQLERYRRVAGRVAAHARRGRRRRARDRVRATRAMRATRWIAGQHEMNFLDLGPIDRVAGTVRMPGSKSMSNRVLLLAALAAGRRTSATCSTPTTRA